METVIQPSGILQRLAAYPRKKPGAVLSLETMIYIAVIIVFMALGIGLFSQRESAKVTACNQEMDQIRSAIVQYSSYSTKDNVKELGDLGILFNEDALSADNAIDNVQHGPFLQKTGRWKDGKAINPWGIEYKVSDGKITTTDSSGKNYELSIFSPGK